MLSCSIDLTLINVVLKSFLELIAGSLLIIFLFIIPVLILSMIFQKTSPFKKFDFKNKPSIVQIAFFLPFFYTDAVIILLFMVNCTPMGIEKLALAIKYYFFFILLCAAPMLFIKIPSA